MPMPGWRSEVCAALLLLLAAPFAATAAPAQCAADALCVGPGQQFATLAAALAAVPAGGTIDIVAGTYREAARIDRPGVTLRGIGGRPHFDCTGVRPANDKACLLVAANGVTFDNLEISGAQISEELGANAACIRNLPENGFTVRNVICHGSQEGILSYGGTIAVDRSLFYDNGWTDRTHNVYFDGDCTVTVRDSTFADARDGHEFKSRCPVTKIYGSTFRSSRGSRNLDIPDGGATLVDHSVLVKTVNAPDEEIVGFTAESCKHPGTMTLRDVRIVNSRRGAVIHNFDRCTGHPIVLDHVTFEGLPVERIGDIVVR
jgi:hypothetical protein